MSGGGGGGREKGREGITFCSVVRMKLGYTAKYFQGCIYLYQPGTNMCISMVIQGFR